MDLSCNFNSFTESLGYRVIQPLHPWFVGSRIGGMAKMFEHNLTFTTVRGAGHMVPIDKPEMALKVFRHLLGRDAL